MKINTVTACLICIFTAFVLNAQDNTNFVIKEFNKRAHIKTQELNKDFIKKLLSEKEAKKQIKDFPSPLANDWESVISSQSSIESEVYAAVNPLDSSNIIVSPISMDPQSMSDVFYCPVYYTTDFGESWQASSFKTKPQREDLYVMGGGDPAVIFDTKGRAYLTWLSLSMSFSGMMPDSMFWSFFWTYSDDGGKTWNYPSDPILENFEMDYITQQFSGEGLPDKEWLAADQSGGKFHDNIYMSFVRLAVDENSEPYKLMLYRKEAGSSSFLTNPAEISRQGFEILQFCTIDVDSKGYVHALFYGRKNGLNSIYHAVSKDGGKSFLPETKVSDFSLKGSNMLNQSGDSVLGITRERLYPAPEIAADRSEGEFSGNIYATWTGDGPGNNDKDIFFARSEDEGNTWSEPIILNDDSKGKKTSNFYSSIAVNNKGSIAVSWYDRREDENNENTHYYIAFSFNGGKNFTKSFPVTAQSSDFNEIGMQNGGFGIGEYNKLLMTEGYAIPVWADGRKGSGDVDIYAAFVPLSGDYVGVEKIVPVSSGLSLDKPSPNPVKDNLNFSFTLPTPAFVRFEITDINGNIIRSYPQQKYGNGNFNRVLNPGSLPNGAYFLRLNSEKGYAVQRFTILR